MLWPPMPAPPTLTASTFVASEDATDWVGDPGRRRTRGPARRLERRELGGDLDRPVWRAVTASLRRPRRASSGARPPSTARRSTTVSTPEAMPVSPSMGMALSIELQSPDITASASEGGMVRMTLPSRSRTWMITRSESHPSRSAARGSSEASCPRSAAACRPRPAPRGRRAGHREVDRVRPSGGRPTASGVDPEPPCAAAWCRRACA